jgi:hypothetical protein
MMRGQFMKRGIIFGIIILLISTSVIPATLGSNTGKTKEKNANALPSQMPEKTTFLSIYVFGKTELEKHDIIVSSQDAAAIYSQFQELRIELTAHPFSEKTQRLKQEFLILLEEKNAIPAEVSKEELMALLQPPVSSPHYALKKGFFPFEGKASEFLCTFVSSGTGSALPIIILPRFIPILLTPIPRVFIRWNVKDGLTSCGGLRSGTGFIAYGAQKGVALGFWGIGLTFSLPPIMNFYGLAGYALYATVNADVIDHYPPNNPPEITQTDPADGQQMVPLSTSELRFSIEDLDGDLMSYTVTTNPDVGSGSGGLKPDGVYSIPLNGLESLTAYTCLIQVTDGEDSTEKTVTFTTEPAAPIISNPSPVDGDREVSIDILHLQFTLKDYQGDAMEYTVQTSPNIGSDHKIGVHNGTYTVPVSGLIYGTAYRWFVNVTDGTHWTRKVFSFGTGYPSPFDPFTYGWRYRKQITINHTQVAGDLENFPVVIGITDPDLIKAQIDGDDILFMNGVGASTKIHHEIETFNHASGNLVVWVNVSSISSNQDTIFYMYYGNPNSINQEYPQKTWDSHYLAVWHMDDATPSTIVDSTFNGYKGTKVASDEPIEENGKVGKSQNFDGTNDYIQFANTIIPIGSKTISAWVKKGKTGWQQVFANSQGDGSPNAGTAWCFDDTSGGILEFDLGNAGSPDHYIKVRVPVPDFEWHYYTMVFDSGNPQMYGYRDGALIVSSTKTIGTEAPPNYNLRMGKSNDMYTSYLMKGELDEIQISNTVESPQWISTEYANQNNPSAFLSIGPEESGP